MTRRRLLGDTVVEVAFDAVAASAGAALQLRQITVALPIELALRRSAGQWEIVGDVPRTVFRTAFDVEPGRLEVVWVAGARP
jgi:hypothetical protein